MPTEELLNANQDLDFIGTRDKVKSIEARADGLVVTMQKRSGDEEFLVSRTMDNYKEAAALVMLAYTLDEVLSFNIAKGRVNAVGIGRLSVSDNYP